MGCAVFVVAVVVVTLASAALMRAFAKVVYKPYKISKMFKEQGVKGPPYKLLIGSLFDINAISKAARERTVEVGGHDIVPRILPHYHTGSSQYGKTFLYWLGAEPFLWISDPEMVKQVCSSKFEFFTQPEAGPDLKDLVGKESLPIANGADWARSRRVVSSSLTMDKLKMMTENMAACTLSMLQEWQGEEGQCKEIEMRHQFEELSANIVARATFGTSYAKGKQAFLAQLELKSMTTFSNFFPLIPGFQYIPTKKNVRKRELNKKIRSTIMGIIQERFDSKESGYGYDLLGFLLQSYAGDSDVRKARAKLSMDEIIDNCKTFFFAGHDTTSDLITWTVYLLSVYPNWQESLREEVLSVCGTAIPTADMLAQLNTMTMVILETLRLYSPAVMIARKAEKDVNVGNLQIPKGTAIEIPILAIHREEEFWGPDAGKFNPLRFENGVSGATKNSNAMMPFGLGPRICVGQKFAITETKMVVAMILQRFSFSVSPEYKHAPTIVSGLQPLFGLPVLVKPVVDITK